MAAVKSPHKGQFKKGQVANPKGRPRNKNSLAGLMREISETVLPNGVTVERAIAQKVVDLCMNGEAWAIQFYADRLHGKVAQKVEQDIAVQDLSASVSFKKAPIIDVTPEPEQLQPPKDDGPVSG